MRHSFFLRGVVSFYLYLDICAKGVNAVVASGDSGGMLMVKRDGRWYQVGITSHGSCLTPELKAGSTINPIVMCAFQMCSRQSPTAMNGLSNRWCKKQSERMAFLLYQ